MKRKRQVEKHSPARGRVGGLEVYPLTPGRWKDLERLFGERGACGGCWCMWWRLTRSQFEKQKGAGNKRTMKRIVDSGEIPGILGYVAGDPIAWCAVAPRGAYPLLERSRILKPVDDQSVWSIVCLFVDKKSRRKGITLKLIKAAVEHVRSQGGRIVEGYPVEPKKSQIPDLFAYHGLASTFLKAGFKEVLRRSETRPIMRYSIRRK